MNQQTHLFPKTIMSISFDQDEILRHIVHLYCPGGIECDVTFGYGGFYKVLPLPRYRFDLKPKSPLATEGDSRALPLAARSVRSLMYDPPFVVTNHIESDEYVMGVKYEGYRSLTQLRTDYAATIKEAARVLKPNGILIVKCQDQTHGRSNYFIHCEVERMAAEAGFRAVDLFILLSKNRFVGKVDKQQHARKFHSYFWVFRRKKRDARYENAPIRPHHALPAPATQGPAPAQNRNHRRRAGAGLEEASLAAACSPAGAVPLPGAQVSGKPHPEVPTPRPG